MFKNHVIIPEFCLANCDLVLDKFFLDVIDISNCLVRFNIVLSVLKNAVV